MGVDFFLLPLPRFPGVAGSARAEPPAGTGARSAAAAARAEPRGPGGSALPLASSAAKVRGLLFTSTHRLLDPLTSFFF